MFSFSECICPKCKTALKPNHWNIDDYRVSHSKNYTYVDYYQECPRCGREILPKVTYALDDGDISYM